ncbi:MAG: histidine kinase [Nitrosomonadales bacterium]
MSIRIRLQILFNLILLIGIFIGAAASFYQAKYNILNELESSLQLAEYAIKNGLQDKDGEKVILNENFVFGLSEIKKLHHLKIEVLDSNGKILTSSRDNLNNKNLPPIWFKEIFSFDQSDGKSKFKRIINISNINDAKGSIVISPNLDYDISVLWSETTGVLTILLLIIIAVNLAIYIIYAYTLKDIDNILIVLNDINNKKFHTKKIESKILEFNKIQSMLGKVVNTLKINDQKINMLNASLLQIQENEKKEIGHDLHDELSQDLTSIQLVAQTGVNKSSKNDKDNYFAQIIKISSQINESIRTLIKKLNLSHIEELGFKNALILLIEDWKVKNNKTQLQYSIQFDDESKIPSKLKTNIYRIIQEGLTNITKHSNAKKADIKILKKKNRFLIEIQNDGIKKVIKNPGIGLIGIQERVKTFDGEVVCKKSKGRFILKINI